jgi:bacillithiol system protein YtxJ
MELTPMVSVADLDAALTQSTTMPVLLFKHSDTCGISEMAFDEMRAHLQGRPFSVCYGLITVQTGRHVSDEVVRRLGVRHESPQVILVRDGKVLWHASHHHVTAEEIESALREHVPPA